MISAPLLPGVIAIDVVENQTNHQPGQPPACLFRQCLPRRYTSRLYNWRIGEQIELVYRGLAQHGELPDSCRESAALIPCDREEVLVSCRSVAKAPSTARSISRTVAARQLALTPRSNIHAGTSSHRSDTRPERLQRKTAAPPFDYFMNMDLKPGQRMPRIKNFALNTNPVGVPLSSCTTPSDQTHRSAQTRSRVPPHYRCSSVSSRAHGTDKSLHPHVREGNLAGVRLQADEPRVRIDARRVAAEDVDRFALEARRFHSV